MVTYEVGGRDVKKYLDVEGQEKMLNKWGLREVKRWYTSWVVRYRSTLRMGT